MNIKTWLGAGLLALATVGTAAHAQKTLLFNLFMAPQDPFNTLVMKPWADDVAKATNGRVKIEFAPASLAAPQAQMDGVVKGVFDGAYMYHGFLQGKVKLSQIAHLPFINVDAKGSSVALWRTYERYFAKADEYHDVQLLSLFTFPGGPIYSMHEPIKAKSQLAGIKVYSVAGNTAEMLQTTGAGMVVAPAARSYEIISGGTVDAFAGYPLYSATAFHTIQYAKSITDIPGQMSAPSFALFVNKKRWNAIPEADRKIVMSLSGEAFAARLAAIDKLEEKLRQDAAARGVPFLKADDSLMDSLRQFGGKLQHDWLAAAAERGVDGEAALKMYEQEAKNDAH
ncbi:TRAP transporter substrate-binding protein DctP [Eoetvoesiella caeni]